MNRSFLSIIANRGFRNLWFGQITSQIALNMLNFVLIIRVYEVTRSNTAVSSMLLTFAIPSIFMGVLAGGIVEYFDKRSVLLLCNGFRTLLFVAFFFFSDQLFVLYILNVLMSVGTQLFIPAEAPAISYLVPRANLLRANSLFAVTFFLSTMIGFALAGPVIRFVGYRSAYLSMGLLMTAATYFAWLLPRLINGKVNGTFSFDAIGGIMNQIHKGILFIRHTERVRRSLVLLTVSQALISTLVVLAPGFADQILKVDLADASHMVMGSAAAGLIVGALFVGYLGARYLKGTLITTGIVGTAIMLIFLSFISEAYIPSVLRIPNVAVSVALLFFIGFFNSLINVPANTILQQDSDESMRGRIYGVVTSLTGGVSLLPVIGSGVLADVIGVGETMAVIGITLLLTTVVHHTIHSR